MQTGETDIKDDILGDNQFQAPDEGTGTDATLTGYRKQFQKVTLCSSKVMQLNSLSKLVQPQTARKK